MREKTEETFHCLLLDTFWILNHVNKLFGQKKETDKIKPNKGEEKLTDCDVHKRGFAFLSEKEAQTDLFSCSRMPRSFFSPRTAVLGGLAFYLHGCFLVTVRWLRQLRLMSSNKHPPNKKERTRKTKNFSLMMPFVLGMRRLCTVIGLKWILGPILNQFLAKGNRFLLASRGRAAPPDIMECLYWYRKGVLLLGRVWKSAG